MKTNTQVVVIGGASEGGHHPHGLPRRLSQVRSRLSRLVTTATTLYKQGYELPLTCTLGPPRVTRRSGLSAAHATSPSDH